MIDDVEDLFDYDALRRRVRASMTVVELAVALVVLGSRQSANDLRHGGAGLTVRRRRGGGGAVLAQPGDLWVDWWIPPGDPRWTPDVRHSAVAAGLWWAEALREVVPGVVGVHDGPLEGAPAHRVACFAGRGPGEVFVDDRKAVGLTQWRVREGALISTILPAHASTPLVELLVDAPAGLARALEHHTIRSLGNADSERLAERLARLSGAGSVEHHRLGD